MDMDDAAWQGRSQFYLPSAQVSDVVSAFMDVRVTMTAMPFFTIDRINIPLGAFEPIQIGPYLSDESGFISLTPQGMQQVTTKGEVRYWCIDLFRGMTSRLLGLDLSEGKEPYRPVSEFHWLSDLAKDLRSVQDNAKRVELCEAAIGRQSEQTRPADEVEIALFYIFASQGALSVQSLADRVGINRRKLERVFRKRLGYSPFQELSMAKTFQTLENMVHGEAAPWRQQKSTGFVDQSHFIRRTKDLAGTTPTKLMGRYIWQTNKWFPSKDSNAEPNSKATFEAWHAHYARRIDALCAYATPITTKKPDHPAPFRLEGATPDYPLNPWAIM